MIKNKKSYESKDVTIKSKTKKLDDKDLLKVAGGFEVTVPFNEFIESNLKADERTDENSDAYPLKLK